MTFGLIGVVPALHYGAVEGFFSNFTLISLGWLLLMGFLYIAGALLYALRVPERFFPGRCDLLVSTRCWCCFLVDLKIIRILRIY